MTDSVRILVDTNVLLDVTEADEQWRDWSQEQMSRYVGRLLVNPIIYTELCYEAGKVEDVDAVLITLGLGFEELPRQALFLASQAFKFYRRRGGNKTIPLPDFFIGAHAAAKGIPILTRDVARYRSYFPDVSLIHP
jgi:predicted nucleic acid-binding protein